MARRLPYVNRNTEVEIDSIHRAPTSEAAEFMHGKDLGLLQLPGQRQLLSLQSEWRHA